MTLSSGAAPRTWGHRSEPLETGYRKSNVASTFTQISVAQSRGVQRPLSSGGRNKKTRVGFCYGLFTGCLRPFYGPFTAFLRVSERPLTKGLSDSGRGSSGSAPFFPTLPTEKLATLFSMEFHWASEKWSWPTQNALPSFQVTKTQLAWEDIVWMDEFLHHFKAMVESIVCWHTQ